MEILSNQPARTDSQETLHARTLDIRNTIAGRQEQARAVIKMPSPNSREPPFLQGQGGKALNPDLQLPRHESLIRV